MKRFALMLTVITAALACNRSETTRPAAPAAAGPAAPAAVPYDQQILQWRANRLARLTSDDSWLTLVGLLWLNEGKNEVALPARPPAKVRATLHGGKVTIDPLPGMTIDGKLVSSPVELHDDADPKGPTVVALGTLRFHAIKRNDRYAFRVKDKTSDARTHFAGLDYFPVDPRWRVEARWVPYNPPRKIPITNVLGMTSDEVAPGRLEFAVDGKPYSIEPILEQGETDLFIIFRDATAGKETYPAARYLYASPAGPDGKVIVDFNKAYNPPCAFTPYATCPLPPAQNKLPFRIEAGEKKYAGGHA